MTKNNPNIKWQWYKFEELNTQQVYDILALREEVFIIEQQCLYTDCDYLDQHSHHLLGYDGDTLALYARIIQPEFEQNGKLSVGRFVCKKSHRNTGLWRVAARKILGYCKEHYPTTDISGSAQLHLKSIYQRFGAKAISEAYDDEGVMHIDMVRKADYGKDQ